jgi:hypothetical protein
VLGWGAINHSMLRRSILLRKRALLLTLNSSAATTSPANTSSTPTPSPTPNADPYAIGGAINPEYYTSKGAFNGSGIALASQSFASNLQDAPLGSLVMYYQHHSGDIRFQRLTSEGAWVGGTQSEIVASNAKNSTPLSAVAYVQNGTSQWHVFCKIFRRSCCEQRKLTCEFLRHWRRQQAEAAVQQQHYQFLE